MKKILYFTAAWCAPCKTLGPIIESLSGQINYQKIDVDSNQDMSIKYGVRNVPSLILINEKGETLNKLVGVSTKEQILKLYNG